jgi:hypothetical protein
MSTALGAAVNGYVDELLKCKRYTCLALCGEWMKVLFTKTFRLMTMVRVVPFVDGNVTPSQGRLCLLPISSVRPRQSEKNTAQQEAARAQARLQAVEDKLRTLETDRHALEKKVKEYEADLKWHEVTFPFCF